LLNSQNRKLAIITGGTKGFGKHIALRLSSKFDLALIYTNDTINAENALKEIQSSSSGMIRLYKLDVSDFELAEKIHDQINADFNKTVSILVNSAGVALKNLFVMEDLLDHKRVFEVNYFGAIHMCKLILPSMLKEKFGRIINISTNNVSINTRGSTAYCASKSALEKFSEILGGEVARSLITVNCIRPGMADTEMSKEYLNSLSEKSYQDLLLPSGQLINGEEVARTVEFLIESNQINSTTITVDTGHALFKKS
jgi:3-oxoacyl-[acyl-carrier protein] reductase